MVLPAAMQPLSTAAAAPHDNYVNTTKKTVWSTSFENGEEAIKDFIESRGETEEKRAVKNLENKLTTKINTSRGWTGSRSLTVSGKQTGGDAFASNIIADNLAIPVTDDMYLSYLIRPGLVSSGWSSSYDYEYTQMYMTIDLKFSDGTYLSELGAKDQNENLMTGQAQGDSRVLVTDQWNRIYSKISEAAKGKTISQILAVFDRDAAPQSGTKDFTSSFDDIELYTKQDYNYEHLSDYVYILRGTNDSTNFSRGLTAPAVTAPHGFNFWVPCTNTGTKMYDYSSNTLRYIKISHEASYWTGDRGTWEFMLSTSASPSSYASSSFSHDKEIAKAHYYSVEFDKDGGEAKGSKLEMTATDHAAVVRGTFDEGVAGKSFVFGSSIDVSEDKKSFTSKSTDISNGSGIMYVYGEFSEPAVSSTSSTASFEGNTVTMKLATSYLSYDQAKKNLELEVGEKDFDTVMAESQATWDKALGVVSDVQGATEEELINLYSCLYRMNMYPNNMSENTGTKENPVWEYYSPYSGKKTPGKIYINNGFWDTYRTAWSAYALLTPNKETELLDGLVQHYKDQDWIPRWICPGGTNSMVGTSSDVIFADAMAKGVTFDFENAYASALRNGATVSSNLTGGGRKDMNTSIFAGYTAGSDENFSWTIEGYINDYGISQMAKMLAEKETDPAKKADYLSEYEYYKGRAKNYTLLFYDGGDSVSDKWLRGKTSSGGWTGGSDFDPVQWRGDYTETNAYNMCVSVPQDGQGLANLYGGREKLGEKIDTIFADNSYCNTYGGSGEIHEQREAREIKMGQYGHSNQPAHHILYMYNYAGQPWKTQKYVKDVLHRVYTGSTLGQGYIGDEDNGEMSAWYVLSALGFYPVTVGSDEWAIGSPLFDSATINTDDGKHITIKANNNTKENVYIQSMTVDGKDYHKNYIKHDELINSKEIVFNMGSTPNESWGSEEEDLPTSLTGSKDIPTANTDLTKNVAVETKADVTTAEPLTGTKIYSSVTSGSSLFDDTSGNSINLDNTTTIVYANSKAQKADIVTLTSAYVNSAAPTGMKVYGAIEGGEWEELASYSDISFKWSKYTRPFALNNDKKYNFYKVELTGGSSLAEIELLAEDRSATEGTTVEELQEMVVKANKVLTDTLPEQLKIQLQEAIAQAEKVIGEEAPGTAEIKNAYKKIETIIDRIRNLKSAYERIEAEEFTNADTRIVNDGENIGGVKPNTWTMYQDVMFDQGVSKFEIYYSAQSSDAGGFVSVYLDDRNNEANKILTLEVPKTGSWRDYELVATEEISGVEPGVHDVYLVFTGNNAYVSNVDWFKFYEVESPDKQEAKKVDALINKIGTVTLESEEAIQAARTAYEALTDDQKALVTKLDVLTAAEEALVQAKADKAVADKVTEQIAGIGEVTLESEEAIQAARAAYEALTDAQKNYVTNLQTLKDAEKKLADLIEADKAKAAEVAALIEEIGEVTLESEEKITTVRAAYEALTDSQKAYVENLEVLTAAEARLQELKDDRQKVQDTMALIDAIGVVSLDSKKAIGDARKAYDALTEVQNAQITNLDVLKVAEETLAKLEQDKKEAEKVEDLIRAIGKVTEASKEAIRAASAAFEKLTASQKGMVENLDTLIDAEKAYAVLTAADPTAGDRAAAGVVEGMIAELSEIDAGSRNVIEAVRTAYEALTAEQKAYVTNVEVLKKAEKDITGLEDAAAAAKVSALIKGIGDVTLESEAKIQAARTAYDALTDAQKKLVTEAGSLTTAENSLKQLKADKEKEEEEKQQEELKRQEADQKAADDVEALIDAIGEVTEDSEEAIEAAATAYEKLTASQKGMVENLGKLIEAEKAYAVLTAVDKTAGDRAAAAVVEQMISGLGTVDVNSGKAIETIRAAYDALTAEQKAFVENAADLEKAEKAFKELEDKKDGDKKEEDKKPVQLAQPVIQSVKSTASKKEGSRVKITVSAPQAGQKTEIYRKAGDSKVLIAVIEGTVAYDSQPVSGKTVSYYAKAVSKDTAKYLDSAEGREVSIKLPADVKRIKTKALGGRKVRISWKKVKKAKYYLIYRSEKKGSGYVRIARVKGSKYTYTDKKVKAGKKYYYKVVTKKASMYSAGKVSKRVKAKK